MMRGGQLARKEPLMASLDRKEAVDRHFTDEFAKESAASLGRSGLRVEAALRQLRAAERGTEERARRLKVAVEAVYYYFIQREAWGSVDHGEAIALYDIPDEVLKRLGST
jgi:hypothetical protein